MTCWEAFQANVHEERLTETHGPKTKHKTPSKVNHTQCLAWLSGYLVTRSLRKYSFNVSKLSIFKQEDHCPPIKLFRTKGCFNKIPASTTQNGKIYIVAHWVVLHLMNHLQNLRSCCIQIEFHCVHCVPWNSMVALLETPNRSNFLSHGSDPHRSLAEFKKHVLQ